MDNTYLFSFCTIAIVLLSWVLSRQHSPHLRLQLPPGPKGIPFFGNSLQIPEKHEWFYYDKLHKKYGPLVHLKVLGQHRILIGELNLTKEIFNRRSNKYSSRSNPLFFTKYVAPHGRHWIFEPNNSYWRLARQLSGPLMADVRRGKTERLQTMEAKVTIWGLMNSDNNDNNGNGNGDWRDPLARFASSSAMSAAYGIHCPTGNEKEISEIVELNDLISSASHPFASIINFIPPFLENLLLSISPSGGGDGGGELGDQNSFWSWRIRAAKIRDREDELYKGLFERSKSGKVVSEEEEEEEENKTWARRIDTSLRRNSSYNKKNISEKDSSTGTNLNLNLDPSFLAGQLVNAAAETTFITLKTFVLAWILYPDTIIWARKNVDRVLMEEGSGKEGSDEEKVEEEVGGDGDGMDGTRIPTFEDRERLPWIDALVRETFRWRPSLPYGMPHMTTEDDVIRVEVPSSLERQAGDQSNGVSNEEVKLKEYFIPKGSLVYGSAWTIEHDPITYPDPDKFIPQRHILSGSNNSNTNSEEGKKTPSLTPNKGTAYGWGKRVCAGEPFADRSLWINFALMIWGLEIEKDPNFEYDPDDWTGEFLSHPNHFPCHIRPRSQYHQRVIEKEWKDWKESGRDVKELLE